ncbi:Uma2 family endonuclease [Pseudanabaena sp. PCC 6802]|uniref:Uma2 family endonuclease n=1 Tax=Pseudanabaena sp. PCC 6802 TaxID=118173 RepID=UPI0003477C81|nr:Uma2 family endonuclease [Pseudanabaena sp. PCC 6802]
MVQAIPQLMTFDEFIAWYPEDGRYELINGRACEVKPTGLHEQIGAYLNRRLLVEIDRLQMPYFIPKSCTVKPFSELSGYLPDLVVIDRTKLNNEPHWQRESTLIYSSSMPLVVEVASTNWRDDYQRKAADYEEMGIPEFWIADYLGIGGRRYIGTPKQPTFSVYQLVDGEYQVNLFRGSERIVSPTFPELNLTLEQLLNAAKIGDGEV